MLTRQAIIEAIVNVHEEKWIQTAKNGMKKRGTEGKFSAEAKSKGYDTCTYARKVMSGEVEGNRKRANFALNTGCKK